jgi:hypothetical protein
MAEDRAKKTRAGHLVRMLNIPAERAFGVFDHPGPDGDAASFAKQCKLAAATAYGTAGPEFVRRPSSIRYIAEKKAQVLYSPASFRQDSYRQTGKLSKYPLTSRSQTLGF